MGLISNIRQRWTEPVEVLQLPDRQNRSGESLANPSNEYITFMAGGSVSDSGITVSPEVALKNMGLYAAIKTIVEPLSHMPIPVIDTRSGLRTRRRDHAVHKLMNIAFNDEHHSMEGREMLFGHYLLRGNGFAQILRDKFGRPAQLWPLHPDRMRAARKDGVLSYVYQDSKGREIPLEQKDVLHLRNLLNSDGIMGQGFILQAANALGLSVAAEKFASKLYQQGARPSGILKHPKTLSEETRKKLAAQFQAAYSGVDNFGKMAIIEEGMDWQKMGLTAEEAQIIESRKFQIEDIARGLCVPGHKVGLLDRATFSNIEHQSLEFVVSTLMAHARRFEMVILRDLFDLDEQLYLEARYNFNALVRGDMKTRYESYAISRQWGWMSADDVRELEDMDPLPDGQGKIYLFPLNMGNAAKMDEYKKDQATTKDAAQEAPKDKPARNVFTGDFRPSLRQSFMIMAVDTCNRLAKKEGKAVENALKSASLNGTPADFRAKTEHFYGTLEGELRSYCEPLARSFAAAVAPENAEYEAELLERVLKAATKALHEGRNAVTLHDFSQPERAYRAISETLGEWKTGRGEMLANALVAVFDPDVKEVMRLCAA